MQNDNRPKAGSPPAEEAGSLISAVYGRPSSILNPPVIAAPVIPQPLRESSLLPPIVPSSMIPPHLSASSMYPPTMLPTHMVAQAEDAEREARRLRREEQQRQYSAYERKKEEARKKGLYLVDAEDDGLNERGIPRGPPKTPPGDPPPAGFGPEHHHIQHQQMMMPPIRSNLIVIPPEEFDDVSDDSDEPPPKREPIGPRTPPDDGFMPPIPQISSSQVPKPASDGELSGDDSETLVKSAKSSEKKKKPRHSDVHLKRSQIFSPLRRLYQHRDVQPRKRRSEEEKKPEVVKPDNSRELTFPAYATKKCLELLEFTEKKGLTITDDELYEVVREGIELDQAMERILEKKELMKDTMERMRDVEMDKIKRIHSNMPRHMQDVLKFDGKTVHINQESVPPVPSMPFGTSSLMSLKYPPAQHMGVPPPGFPPPFAPHIGVPPPTMGMPPPPMGVGAPPFAMPPPVSLLGPPPFGMQPPSNSGNTGAIVPPVIQPVAPPPSIMSENEKRNMITHGLNPLAFSSQSDFGMPPALKKPGGPQDPQVVRVTNNLSNMLTNALKAQVSKSQSSLAAGSPSGTPTKKPVPSLMSINIPGIPKSGTPGSSQN